ncbi:MAG TPA: ribonuclease Z [Nitrososphaeraceae archaeon]|nr:ribonuclease Z [Nitrososphaeraceae archaeon]
MVELKLVFLGTSAAIPTYERGLSSLAIVRGNEIIIFDAGEGMQIKFIRSKLGMNKKMKIFITHIHGDHCLGLLGLLQTLSLMGRTKPIDIFGEPRLQEFISVNRKILNFNINYQIIVHTIQNEGILVKEKDYLIKACYADHSILAFSFILEENNRPGVFNIERAQQSGIPEGQLYTLLQRGVDIEYNGTQLLARDFTGPSRPGRKVGISGDTRPSKKLEIFFRDCDVLVFESTFITPEKDKAIERFHSTALEASLLAKIAKVKKLILTHFSSRYTNLKLIEMEAKKNFENIHIAQDNDVISVPYPEKELTKKNGRLEEIK